MTDAQILTLIGTVKKRNDDLNKDKDNSTTFNSGQKPLEAKDFDTMPDEEQFKHFSSLGSFLGLSEKDIKSEWEKTRSKRK